VLVAPRDSCTRTVELSWSIVWAVRAFYDAWYRWGTPPWVGGPRPELVSLVSDGTLRPGRAIDLGCGEGDNAIFLAQHGFSVTGVDFAPAAIAKARRKVDLAGVNVDLRVADLTQMLDVGGPFDLLVDYGTLDDLTSVQRDAYVRHVVPLAGPGSQFLLWCFEWELRLGERLLTSIMPFGKLALAPREVERRFEEDFEIEAIAGERDLRGWPRGWAAYLMHHRNH
jgi:SAM-dependent methyltransferase